MVVLPYIVCISLVFCRSDNASRHTVCHSSSEVNVFDKSHHRSLSASKISPPLKHLLAVDGNNSTGGKVQYRGGDLSIVQNIQVTIIYVTLVTS